MATHRLDPLLRPRSLAIVGASRRPGSVGHTLVRQALRGGFNGDLWAVNPKYAEIEGVACYPTLADLPAAPEHVVLAVSDSRVEAAFEAAVDRGARAATLISQLAPVDGRDPPLRERLRARAREADILVCGGNSNGLYNFAHGLWLCGFETRDDHRAGGVALITHSGSVFNALVDCEARIDYGLAISAGQELTVGLADYMDFALAQAPIKVIALFMEGARDPAAFVAALARANERGVPVVALKIGRSARGGALAESHSGALAGDDAAYQAVFDRYGVARVTSLDELAATVMLFAQPRPVGPGKLATIHDSGGERALIVDLADQAGVDFAKLQPATVARLEAALDPGLPAVNPLDAWGTGARYHEDFTTCLTAMMQDPGTALGAVVADRGPGGLIFPEYPKFARAAAEASGKPVAIVSNHQGSGAAPEAVQVTRAGLPVLDGVPVFLEGVRHVFDHRDFRARAPLAPPHPPEEAAQKWRARLAGGRPLSEVEALSMLGDFAVPVAACAEAGDLEEASAAAEAVGYPVALKTARSGLAHKSDEGGVVLDLADSAALARAYERLAESFGPRVVVARMARGPAVEMILGLVRDPDFGPVVVLGGGGVHAEVLNDAVFALPPFDAAEAMRLVGRLRLRALLDGPRGAPAADVAGFCRAAANFSVLATALGEMIETMDVNPVLVHSNGCVAVDALVRLRADPASRAA